MHIEGKDSDHEKNAITKSYLESFIYFYFISYSRLIKRMNQIIKNKEIDY
jgi:hypothetical protein